MSSVIFGLFVFVYVLLLVYGVTTGLSIQFISYILFN